jgi:lipoprotein-anchoring transpeptidase ErfK/SrfK
VLGVLVVAGCSATAGPSGSGPAGAAGPAPVAPPGPTVTVDPAASISPITPVHVRAVGGRLTSVVMSNAGGDRVAGTTSPDGSTWQSTGRLAYGGTYTVVADAVSAQGTPTHQQSTVTTLTPKSQDQVSTVPGPNTSSVGVGQPVSVTFSHAVADKDAAVRALSVTSTPAQPGAWHWISATQVDYRPATYWRSGTTVTVKGALFGADLGGGAYGAADLDRTFHVHDSWVAKADGQTKQMQILDNGALVKTMNISLGSPQAPTHTGAHVISDKQPSVVMDSSTYGVGPGQPGYYRETVLLDERISNDGEFVHSAPWSVGQQGSDNVSHGCVNLSPADAQWFYDHFGIGDVVEVSNSGGPPLPIWDRWGDWALSWSQWQGA